MNLSVKIRALIAFVVASVATTLYVFFSGASQPFNSEGEGSQTQTQVVETQGVADEVLFNNNPFLDITDYSYPAHQDTITAKVEGNSAKIGDYTFTLSEQYPLENNGSSECSLENASDVCTIGSITLGKDVYSVQAVADISRTEIFTGAANIHSVEINNSPGAFVATVNAGGSAHNIIAISTQGSPGLIITLPESSTIEAGVNMLSEIEVS